MIQKPISELLKQVLNTMVPETTVEEIYKHRSSKEIQKLLNVSEEISNKILAILDIVDLINTTKISTKEQIKNPEEAIKMLSNLLKFQPVELSLVMLLDNKCQIIQVVQISKGSSQMSVVSPRDIFFEAISKRATAIIFAHNHPSGDPTPSEEDNKLTISLKEIGKLIGIELLDHVIIGKNSNYSYAEEEII